MNRRSGYMWREQTECIRYRRWKELPC